jgi:hypothetical protein
MTNRLFPHAGKSVFTLPSMEKNRLINKLDAEKEYLESLKLKEG